jgi:hypothetical protein
MAETQALTLETIAGPKKIKAPGRWQFDKTAIIVWSRLLQYTRERLKPQKRKRDEHELDAQIHALSIVLANSLGMAPPYWELAAKELLNA